MTLIKYFKPFLALYFILLFTGRPQETRALEPQDTTKSPVILEAGPGSDSTFLPGERLDEKMRPEQDEAYKKALLLNIPPGARFKLDLLAMPAGRGIIIRQDALADEESIYEAYYRQFEKTPESMFVPLGTQRVLAYENISRSQHVDGARGIPKPGTQLEIPLSSIGQFLGLVPDLSPNISYALDRRAEVKVLIYSVQAKVVRVLVEKVQNPGKYSFRWNGRDDDGKMAPSGDYVAEVRIGNTRIITKRIRI